MPAPPSRNAIAGTGGSAPSNATGRTGFGALWDYVTALLGASGDAVDARTALGAAGTAGATFTGGINEARGTVAMHATTMDLWAQPNVIDGTGSAVTITAIANAPQAGARRTLYPIAGTVITNGATFAVDGAANYTTAAGDKLEFEAITISTYKVHITKRDGTAITSSGITLSTAVATTSGTAIDFTGIPSTAKRISIMLKEVSTNGTAALQFQLGAGSIQTSGYGAAGGNTNGAPVLSTSSFISGGARGVADTTSGSMIFSLQDAATNTWVGQGILAFTNGAGVACLGGHVVLTGVLDRIRLTADGVNIFDNGSCSISVET